MILIELTAAVTSAGTPRTFYVSDARFVTLPSDTPANTAFDPSLIDPGAIGIHAYGDGRTGGATRLETGEIILDNTDGQYDAWLNYSFDGRPVVIRSGSGGSYPASYSVLLVATVESLDASPGQVIVKIRDKQLLFDTPVLTSVYGGTNSLPNGLDGLPTDLKGKRRPRAWGKVFNVTPPQVNTSRLIFEVGACNSVDAVYSNGAALAAGAVYTTQADMDGNAPAAGQFRAWPAGGYFRIGMFAGEQITADVTQGATAADRTVGQVLKRISASAGITSAELSNADVTTLDQLNSAEVGIWIDDDTTVASALDMISASIGAWYGFDPAGVLRMGQLTAPAGQAVLTLHDYDILSLERRAPSDNGVPAWRATVNHSRCFTVQTSGLAGSAAARAGFVGQERRSVNADAPDVKTQWLRAGELSVDTLLVSDVAAQAEVTRLLSLYRVRRDVFEVSIDVSVLASSALRMMDVVNVFHPRFGLSSGRLLRAIGISFNLAAKTVILSLWG